LMGAQGLCYSHIGHAGPFCALGNRVSWHPQNGRLLLSERAEFLLFEGAQRTPTGGLVVSAVPLCSVRTEASLRQQNSKAWSLGFTCMCGSRLLALSSKLRVSMGQQIW
jgi:hypothetical protein